MDTLDKFKLPDEVRQLLKEASSIVFPKTKEEIVDLALGGKDNEQFEVTYEMPDGSVMHEATVMRCRNGLAANYPDSYMRRRDPDTLIVADDNPSDKTHFTERFEGDFHKFRGDVLEWFKGKDLIVLPFYAGTEELGYNSLMIGPKNSAFFAGALADLQGFIPPSEIPNGFEPTTFIYLAPPFRHTHCGGKQVVIHNRENDCHELFSLNLYPGPSAKKGIYGVLLSMGEKEGWVTLHGSTVQIITPYDNEVNIVHEGASGGGKSEMLQYPHRESDGRLMLGQNTVTGEKTHVPNFQGCQLFPVTDDMALCPPKLQEKDGKLVVSDAEDGWFVRVNHIKHYGVDTILEGLCTCPPEPLVFLNMYAVPNSTCLIWEHTEDEPGVPCPNPRVILPRRIVPDIQNDPVSVDIRSFGIRTPPCTRENPTYGIVGVLHLLPPALAWLWRMVSPRGHANPSITDTAGMSSEGVGSYWPFATGRRVDQANLLLEQILKTPRTRYVLIPNQYLGAWKTGFAPQWIAREYLARRGSAKFRRDHLSASRCPLLGYSMKSMQVEGSSIHESFLQVEKQPEVGVEAYDKGAKILTDFFKEELAKYMMEDDLDDLGRRIINCCMNDGGLEDYENLTPLD